MALESGTYINSLVITNPEGTDQKNTLDDHVRLIKTTLKNTFPNVSGIVSASSTELNYLNGVTSNIQDQINTKHDDASLSLTAALSAPLSPLTATIQALTAMSGDRIYLFYCYPNAGVTTPVIHGYNDGTSAVFAYVNYNDQTFGGDNLWLYNNTSATITVSYRIKILRGT